MINNPPKFKSKLFSGQFLFICVDDLCKYWFWSKLPKNGHFSLNKVSKITNNQNFPKNTKCSKYMIFTQIFNFQPKNSPKGPPDLEDDAALPPDVGMAQAHLPMDQILISLAQMVHFGWEQPLIIPDFGIFKICVNDKDKSFRQAIR